MKVAVTGHSGGIGEYIFNRLTTLNIDCVGFSRSNGFDITNKDDYEKIAQQSDDCDVFINNACDGFGQAELLLFLWERWHNTEKVIVNVGSRIADDGIELGIENKHLLEYAMHKRTLRRLSEDLQLLPTSVIIEYVTFAYVGIERILKKYPNMKPGDYIEPEEAVDRILDVAFQRNKNT